MDEEGMISIAELDGGNVNIKELGTLNTAAVLKDLFVAQEFIVTHFENQEIVLYYMREDAGLLEEVPGSRLNLDLPSDYAFDVQFSSVPFLENSTRVNVLFTPNNSKNNVLTQMEVIKGTNEGGDTIFTLQKVEDHDLDDTNMNTFAVSTDYVAIGCE